MGTSGNRDCHRGCVGYTSNVSGLHMTRKPREGKQLCKFLSEVILIMKQEACSMHGVSGWRNLD